MKKNRNANGYVLVYKPEHPKAMRGGNWDGYIYEHILIAEEVIDRSLKEGEVVHHLDKNRSNNSPDNILVMHGPMHNKLHTWLDQHDIIPKERQRQRMELGCVRCKVCNKPIDPGLTFCSREHNSEFNALQRNKERGIDKPSKEILAKEVTELPMTKLGEKYGVSNNAVKKWCKNYEIDLPPMRGHWTKQKYSDKV
jgi:predicted nucleic acid-binding Zn ribbon protein